ncbi:hypothetical protein LEP1GSC052_1911 [Leptospira kmetyi serovar Malaysia str. Bejo-Iso9]|nr:hypothetical protein LEP1GSC052_1911 [Leptospira kmetyi serovar Malaysia str. Bejo-Iso9]
MLYSETRGKNGLKFLSSLHIVERFLFQSYLLKECFQFTQLSIYWP